MFVLLNKFEASLGYRVDLVSKTNKETSKYINQTKKLPPKKAQNIKNLKKHLQTF